MEPCHGYLVHLARLGEQDVVGFMYANFHVTRSFHKLEDNIICYNKLGLSYYQGKWD